MLWFFSVNYVINSGVQPLQEAAIFVVVSSDAQCTFPVDNQHVLLKKKVI